MLVNRNRYGFSSKKQHVTGTGFVDSSLEYFQFYQSIRCTDI